MKSENKKGGEIMKSRQISKLATKRQRKIAKKLKRRIERRYIKSFLLRGDWDSIPTKISKRHFVSGYIG